jgi:hypothetical protein
MKEIKKFMEPLELIEPMELMSEFNTDCGAIVISCRDPGYLCRTGQISED